MFLAFCSHSFRIALLRSFDKSSHSTKIASECFFASKRMSLDLASADSIMFLYS